MDFYKSMKSILNKKCLLKGRQCNLNPFPNNHLFLCVCSMILLKTLWEKDKLLQESSVSFSHSVFYLFEELNAIFIEVQIVV